MKVAETGVFLFNFNFLSIQSIHHLNCYLILLGGGFGVLGFWGFGAKGRLQLMIKLRRKDP